MAIRFTATRLTASLLKKLLSLEKLLIKVRNRQNNLLFVSTFALTLASPLVSSRAMADSTYTTIHSFGSITNDGTQSLSSLTLGSDGNFYGTTQAGGASDLGAIFKMTPGGIVTILHSFNDGTVANDGKQPYGGIIQGPDGALYGTTYVGGSANQGTIFSISPDGSNYSILHQFGSVANDGVSPYFGHLTFGLDGNLYGTTQLGGTVNAGIAFKIAPDGSAYTILHNFFATAHDASSSSGALIRDAGGNFYGVSLFGGSNNSGSVYKMTPGGIVTILHSFGDATVTNDGKTPFGSLAQGLDGNFYGTTSAGGSASKGTVFEITPAGTVTILHSFEDGGGTSEGAVPRAGLTLGSDGNFYGATFNEGSANKGTLYRITPAGAFKILHTFGDGSTPNDGGTVLGAPIPGTDGAFYGTTISGGANSIGTIYRFLPEHFLVSAPSSSTAGSPFDVTVTAVDDTGSIVTNYTGTVHFTSDDPTATLPADTALINGAGTFSSTLYTAPSRTIRVRDIAASAITTTAGVTINPASLDHLALTAPATATTGAAFYALLSARDQYNNVISSFADTIHFTSTAAQSVLPTDFVLTGGTKQISAKLNSPGTQTITATDTNNSLSVTSENISVSAVVAKLVITGSSTAIAGAPATYTVTAQDTVGNTATSYNGTVHITSTDATATLPADVTLVNGVGTFNVTLKKATTSTVTATDTTTPSLKASGVTIVSAAAASQFTITAPATTTATTAFQSQITAIDAYGNVAKGYTGTVHFTSTDPLAVLPSNTTLTNGTRQVTIKLKSAGSQTFTATDTVNAGIASTSSAISVN